MPRDFRFRIQHIATAGRDAESPLIPELDAYLDGLPDPVSSYGAFAFATAAGVSILAESDAWRRFSVATSRNLLIGFDAITNSSSLEVLRRVSATLRPNSVLGIDPTHPAQLAHPKFLLFEQPTGEVILCLASNNATAPALSQGGQVNAEAYCVVTLDGPNEARECLNEFRQLRRNWAVHLVDIGDPRVDGWATDNDRLQHELVAGSGSRSAKRMAATTGAVSFPSKDNCLIMRVPLERGHSQIGITARIAKQYFGTTHATLRVQYVPQPAGPHAPIEPEAIVDEVLGGPRGGGNIGLELRGVTRALNQHGETFSAAERPLVLLRELAPSFYRYTVLLPRAHTHPYRGLDAWLTGPLSRAVATGGRGSPVLRAVAPTAMVSGLFRPEPFPLD